MVWFIMSHQFQLLTRWIFNFKLFNATMLRSAIWLLLSLSLVLYSVTWEPVRHGSGEVAEIAISLSDPNVVYAVFENNAHAYF